MSTHIFARAALVGAGALALLGPLTAGTAAASAASQESVTRVKAAPYAVVPYENINVRYGPGTSYGKITTSPAGQPLGAYCWTRGERITDNGYSNDVWVKLLEGYVSAVYLKGDEYGDLPSSARC
ncbi:SH3 domain-containing protein [Streptomyces sp. CA-179760]|uniref:SH3 domain-containing protein n=1 Tax=Streptomyces sp. CA-179760 TaxID=3240054 RepID=UPI003D92DF53